MALRASGGICAGKTLCYFSSFATTAVGVLTQMKAKKNKNILKKGLTNVLTYVIIYSNSGILSILIGIMFSCL